jgi:hypothetical protein
LLDDLEHRRIYRMIGKSLEFMQAERADDAIRRIHEYFALSGDFTPDQYFIDRSEIHQGLGKCLNSFRRS